MVQQAKYYSESIHFTEPQSLRHDGRIQAGMSNDNLLVTKPTWKQVPGEPSFWLIVQCKSDLPKNKK